MSQRRYWWAMTKKQHYMTEKERGAYISSVLVLPQTEQVYRMEPGAVVVASVLEDSIQVWSPPRAGSVSGTDNCGMNLIP